MDSRSHMSGGGRGNTRDYDGMTTRTDGRLKSDEEQTYSIQIAFTAMNTFMITEGKRLYSWGSISKCLGREPNPDNNPKEKGEVIVGDQEFINKIATGKNHVLALTENGRLYSWGKNDKGQLGIGNTESQERPQLVKFEDDTTVLDIFAGDARSVAVVSSGKDKRQAVKLIYVWGWNKYDMLCANESTGGSAATIIQQPYKLPADYIQPAKTEDDSTKTYDLDFNLNNPSDSMYYYRLNNKSDRLQKHEKIIDELQTKNFKLKKEKARLQNLLKVKTNEILNKFLKVDEKKKLSSKIEEDTLLTDLQNSIATLYKQVSA